MRYRKDNAVFTFVVVMAFLIVTLSIGIPLLTLHDQTQQVFACFVILLISTLIMIVIVYAIYEHDEKTKK